MPELPEVETIRRKMAPQLEGTKITQVIIRNSRLRWPVPEDLSAILSGQIIQAISRRGKYLRFHCEKGSLIIHLGMSGYLRILPQDTPYLKHDHVDIVLETGQALRLNDSRRFGAVLWTTEDTKNHPLLKNLGPEPLDALSAAYLADKAKKSSVAIKQFIMDSHIVVGVGNIYANEALFFAGIHPQAPAKSLGLPDWKKLTTAIQETLLAAIELGGTTLKDFRDSEGVPGYFQQKLKVYGREGESCYTCSAPLHSLRLGQRATVYCPQCQVRNF